MSKLTTSELQRYSRHIALADVGLSGQEKLKQAKVLVVGAGGLGSPVLLYLAAAGVGHIGIIDDDSIDLSNLQRQVLFNSQDVGQKKATVARQKILALNPQISAISITERITSANAFVFINPYDIVIDCTDNFATRYLLNDACVLKDKTLIYASVQKFEGQFAVFNHRKSDGTFSTNYRDMFPEPPEPNTVMNCEQAGVMGALTGIIGSLQAGEAIKIITGAGEPLADKLLIFDGLAMEQTIIHIPDRQSRKSINSLIDYEDFCGISQGKSKYLTPNHLSNMKEVTVQELKKLKDSGADFQLIDVREPHEFEICDLGGELIPMSEIPYNVDKISKTKQVVIHCRSGKRSGDMLLWLEKNHNFENLYNLKGGILAWAKEIDSSMPQY